MTGAERVREGHAAQQAVFGIFRRELELHHQL